MQGFPSTGNLSPVNLFLACSKLTESYGFIKTVRSHLREYYSRLSPTITLTWLCTVVLHFVYSCIRLMQTNSAYSLQPYRVFFVCVYICAVRVLCIHAVV